MVISGVDDTNPLASSAARSFASEFSYYWFDLLEGVGDVDYSDSGLFSSVSPVSAFFRPLSIYSKE